MLNPLIDKIFELLLTKQVWQVHTLATALLNSKAINSLDNNPERDLFKRNFLIMNALYQLQDQVHPKSLLISTLHIELLDKENNNQLEANNNLKTYYLEWKNYDTSTQDINALLNSFWEQFKRENTTAILTNESIENLTQQWQLKKEFSHKELQKRWRQLALKYHPDKPSGCEEKFKQIKIEYEQLKTAAH